MTNTLPDLAGVSPAKSGMRDGTSNDAGLAATAGPDGTGIRAAFTTSDPTKLDVPTAEPLDSLRTVTADGNAPTHAGVPRGITRRSGAGTDGLGVVAWDRTDRLNAMRAGDLGSVHSWELVTAVDGPGTRMTVFLNGCPLRCLYCHNPDTLAMKDGRPVTAEEVLAKVRRYIPVFRATKGGLTISGGEVLMQPAFAGKLLRGAKEMGVHTAIDTSGFLDGNASDALLDDVDLVLLDVKAGLEDTYRFVTGRELGPTLRFGRRVAERGLTGHATEVWVRFVLVPGLTDDHENVEAVATYVASLNEIRPGTVTRVEVLPFHQMGRDKWASLGRNYELGDTEPPTPELTERVRDQFRAHGLTTF